MKKIKIRYKRDRQHGGTMAMIRRAKAAVFTANSETAERFLWVDKKGNVLDWWSKVGFERVS